MQYNILHDSRHEALVIEPNSEKFMSYRDIYQLIWDNDENGFSVSPYSYKGKWEDENADILLDEQVKADGRREIDLATRPLFHYVNESKLFDTNTTYVSFINLLDNYTVRSLDPEFTNQEEVAEQHKFLSLILQTKPIKITLKYINDVFGENLSDKQFYQKLYHLWFELYTNYYKGKSVDYCSGFEHVFVGEGKYNIRAGSKIENLGKISGYHSWVKFYLDEKNQRVNYLGYKYDLKGDDGPNNPNVVTLQQLQNIINMRGEVIAQLFKSKGGFFVGSSPECEIAMATLAFYESKCGQIRDKKRIKINGANYNIVLYRNINPNGSRGDFVRSFFPIFLGLDKSNNQKQKATYEPITSAPVVKPIENSLINDGAIVIISALPNPKGLDDGKEWVKLGNSTDNTVNLDGWQLFDKLGRCQALTGIIPAKKTKQCYIQSLHSSGIQLFNKSGLILLRDNQSYLIAGVKYGHAKPGEVIKFHR